MSSANRGKLDGFIYKLQINRSSEARQGDRDSRYSVVPPVLQSFAAFEVSNDSDEYISVARKISSTWLCRITQPARSTLRFDLELFTTVISSKGER